jgi:uncharacterized lipoprotein YbaY
MNTIRLTVIALTAALASHAALAADAAGSKAVAQVAYNEPEKFTDFRRSEFYREADAASLQQELTAAIERSSRHALPPGYTLTIRFTDIDLAGDINPFHRLNLTDVRVYRGVHVPRLNFDYAVLDTEGNTVLSGSERIVDMAYDMRLRMPNSDYTRIEADMMGDFVRNLGRKLATATG